MNWKTERARIMKSTFFQAVYEIVGQIPRGSVASYGQIAHLLGVPRAARQVGWAMRSCLDSLPWQRVVKADGSIAGGGWSALRRARLEEEGVPFLPDGRVDMKRCQWLQTGEGEREVPIGEDSERKSKVRSLRVRRVK